MNLILFSLLIGILISFTYNYFSITNMRDILVFIIFDIFLLSTITYFSINILNRHVQNEYFFIPLLLISFLVYIFYMVLVRNLMLFNNVKKMRAHDLEKYFLKKFDKKVVIYKNISVKQIKTFPNKKDIIVPVKISDELDKESICNIIAFNLNTNIFYDILFLFCYFIPAILFFYAITYTTGNNKTILILFASALIFVIKRFFHPNGVTIKAMHLKNKIKKQDLIDSIKDYYRLIIKDLPTIQRTLQEQKMNKSIEAINKYL